MAQSMTKGDTIKKADLELLRAQLMKLSSEGRKLPKFGASTKLASTTARYWWGLEEEDRKAVIPQALGQGFSEHFLDHMNRRQPKELNNSNGGTNSNSGLWHDLEDESETLGIEILLNSGNTDSGADDEREGLDAHDVESGPNAVEPSQAVPDQPASSPVAAVGARRSRAQNLKNNVAKRKIRSSLGQRKSRLAVGNHPKASKVDHRTTTATTSETINPTSDNAAVSVNAFVDQSERMLKNTESMLQSIMRATQHQLSLKSPDVAGVKNDLKDLAAQLQDLRNKVTTNQDLLRKLESWGSEGRQAGSFTQNDQLFQIEIQKKISVELETILSNFKTALNKILDSTGSLIKRLLIETNEVLGVLQDGTRTAEAAARKLVCLDKEFNAYHLQISHGMSQVVRVVREIPNQDTQMTISVAAVASQLAFVQQQIVNNDLQSEEIVASHVTPSLTNLDGEAVRESSWSFAVKIGKAEALRLVRSLPCAVASPDPSLKTTKGFAVRAVVAMSLLSSKFAIKSSSLSCILDQVFYTFAEECGLDVSFGSPEVFGPPYVLEGLTHITLRSSSSPQPMKVPTHLCLRQQASNLNITPTDLSPLWVSLLASPDPMRYTPRPEWSNADQIWNHFFTSALCAVILGYLLRKIKFFVGPHNTPAVESLPCFLYRCVSWIGLLILLVVVTSVVVQLSTMGRYIRGIYWFVVLAGVLASEAIDSVVSVWYKSISLSRLDGWKEVGIISIGAGASLIIVVLVVLQTLQLFGLV